MLETRKMDNNKTLKALFVNLHDVKCNRYALGLIKYSGSTDVSHFSDK